MWCYYILRCHKPWTGFIRGRGGVGRSRPCSSGQRCTGWYFRARKIQANAGTAQVGRGIMEQACWQMGRWGVLGRRWTGRVALIGGRQAVTRAAQLVPSLAQCVWSLPAHSAFTRVSSRYSPMVQSHTIRCISVLKCAIACDYMSVKDRHPIQGFPCLVPSPSCGSFQAHWDLQQISSNGWIVLLSNNDWMKTIKLTIASQHC